VLRFAAAVAVLIWHYQHFYYPRAAVAGLRARDQQPLYHALQLFYDQGVEAVELFWVISGTVFAAVYLGGPRTTARSFFVRRFARLYPLHWVTLFVVAALQLLSLESLGHYQIYPYNDLYHFALHLGMISSWGLQKGWSFNAPIWSVSTELLIYILFFVALPALRRFPILALVAVFLFAKLGLEAAFPLCRCGVYFFLGVSIYECWRLLDHRNRWWPLVTGALLVALVLAGERAGLPLERIADRLGLTAHRLFLLVLFPALVLIAASLDRFASPGRVGLWLGQLTYGTYLWHVPLQILALIILQRMQWGTRPVSSPVFLVSFLVLVVAAAHLSLVYLEEPARRWLTQKWAGPASASAPVVRRA
jgi:peptidoglycan/LPS O-acetylase OafA/YrhL